MKKIVLTIVVIAVLAIAYYLISPLFITIEVNDALPENIVSEAEVVTSGFEDMPKDMQEEMLDIMEEVNKKEVTPMDDAMPEEITTDVDVEDETEEVVKIEEKEESLDLPVQTGKIFPVIGTSGHPASGNVKLIETSDGLVARYEDFSTINGPQLHVYLAKDLKAKEFIDLGPIKGTKGNINYTLPKDADISEYRYIMYWCVPFRVLFNYAELQ